MLATMNSPMASAQSPSPIDAIAIVAIDADDHEAGEEQLLVRPMVGDRAEHRRHHRADGQRTSCPMLKLKAAVSGARPLAATLL